LPARPYRVKLAPQACHREIDGPDVLGALADIVARIEHPLVDVAALGIVAHGLEHAAPLIDERRARLPRGVIDVPAAVDVMELGRPHVAAVPTVTRRGPHRDAVLGGLRQLVGLVDPNRAVLRLDQVYRAVVAHDPWIRARGHRVGEATVLEQGPRPRGAGRVIGARAEQEQGGPRQAQKSHASLTRHHPGFCLTLGLRSRSLCGIGSTSDLPATKNWNSASSAWSAGVTRLWCARSAHRCPSSPSSNMRSRRIRSRIASWLSPPGSDGIVTRARTWSTRGYASAVRPNSFRASAWSRSTSA